MLQVGDYSVGLNLVGYRKVNLLDAVSKNTDFLVVGRKPGNVKLKAAEALGIPQITERQWLNLLNRTYKRTLLNKRVVFTGKLSKSRSELEMIAKKLGAIPTSKISRKTNFLIVGNNPGKSQLIHAEEYSVTIINESIWNEIVATLK